MLHIFSKPLLIITTAIIFIGMAPHNSIAKPQVELASPLKTLFAHKKHIEVFSKTGISCIDCHSFSVKAKGGDPLSPGVGAGFLKPQKQVCHECHLGKVNLPRPNQCTLCHSHVEKLMPDSHKTGWKFRHGRQAQADSDSCHECHTDQSCTKCHTQRDSVKPSVHRPNFRLTHSIEARSNPQSCVTCHSTTTSCIQCHTRGLK